MAESIRYFSPVCEPDYKVRDRWILRLTRIAILVAGVQAFVLAFSLVERAIEMRKEVSAQEYAMPYIPPKPDFKANH